MAVNLMTNQNHGYGLVAMCGVSKELLETAEKKGVQIVHTATGAITIKSPDGFKTYGVVPFKGTAVTLLKEGKLGPASKESVKYQVEKSVKQALDEIPEVEILVESPIMPQNLGEPLKSKLSKSKIEKMIDMEEMVDATPIIAEPKKGFNPFQKKEVGVKMTQVKLKDATKLYQPVFGTSAGSVYHVIARFDGMNLAIRRKNSSLSLRVEGKNLNKYSDRLETVGFAVKEDYASVHLSVDSHTLLAKTIGAVVGAIGFEALIGVGNPLEVL